MQEEVESGVTMSATCSTKKTWQQNLVEEQKRLNRLVQDQRRSVGRIRIPSQLDRWTKVKDDMGLTSHEDVARLLLDSFDKVQEMEEHCIQVSKDVMAAFEDFKVKVKMNADEILKFFLSLGVLPGNKAIAVDSDVLKTFETLKANLALNSTQLMNYLCSLHEGSEMKNIPQAHSDTQSMSQTVRRAVREEISSLIREGLIPVHQAEFQSILTRDGFVLPTKQTKDEPTLMGDRQGSFSRQDYQNSLKTEELKPSRQMAAVKVCTLVPSMRQKGYEISSKEERLAGVTEDEYQNGQPESLALAGNQGTWTLKDGASSPLNPSQSCESGSKRRSRKSQPQRVVVEAEDAVIDLDAEDMEDDETDLHVVRAINGDNLKPQLLDTSDGTSTSTRNILTTPSQYQYVLNGDSNNSVGRVENGTISVSSLQTSNQSTNTTDISQSSDTTDLNQSNTVDLNQTTNTSDESTGCYNSPEDINANSTSFFCPYCTYRTPIIARLKRHMTLHTGKVYKCNKCEKSYTEEYKLREHFKIKHEKSVHFVCEQCRRDFTSKGGLKYHMKTMHRKEFDYWCDACCKGFRDPHTYETHVEIKHNRPQAFTCSNCSNTFKSMANLSMHKKACIRMNGKRVVAAEKKETNFFNRFPCEICPERFSTFHELKDHSNEVHKDVSPYRCACGLEFKLRASYNGHRHNCRIAITLENEAKSKETGVNDGLKNVAIVNVESLRGKFEAKSLDFGSQTSSPLARVGSNSPDPSAKSKHSATKTSVPGDPLSAIQITNLESGEQFILSDKEKSAEPESEKTAESGDDKLVIDLLSHSPENPTMHCCEFCDYKTPKLSHIKRHKMIHTGKKYKCDKCPKSFNEKNKLKVHMNSKHKGHAKYKCEVCYRTFSSKGGIVYHMQTKHNNTHKYRCEVCEKGFNQLQHYMGHKNTHSGIRPHVCDICNQGFSYPSVLVAHRKICKGKKEESEMEEVKFHPCSECGEKFIMQANLEEHIKKEHSQEGLDFSSVLCDCGVVFTNNALKEHKPTCTGATVSQMFVKASVASDVAMETEEENPDFKQISPEKFSLIVSQPVFPT